MSHLTLAAQAWKSRWRIGAFAALVIVLFVLLGVMFFARAQDVMKAHLKESLKNTAAAAAMQFDGKSLQNIKNVKSMKTAEFRDVVERLRDLRDSSPDIRFVYVLRKTSNPTTLEFVADADSLSSDEDLDVNGNGEVDEDEEPGYPGDQYDVSDYPALQGDAFLFPTTDEDITFDQWGALISGYAPVRRFDNGKVVAVLGMDMLAEDYLAASFRIISPLMLFFMLLAVVSLTAGFVLFVIRRQVDTLNQINSERTGLLQLTFHQLGEPLTIFKWSLETLKERQPTESLEKMIPDHVKNMEIGIERMSDIIDALRSAEQIELKTLAYHPVRASMGELVAQVAKDFQPFLAHRNQALDVSCESKFWCTMDPAWISQMMHWLLKNAMSFSPEGARIAIRVSYRKDQVLVEVADNGVGIPAADLPHIFEKFHRGANASVYTQSGTGLSLYTAKGIVDMAKGKISVESQEGKGTTVSFTVPSAA